jgi:DNA-binding transcriptional LysR family regulator
MLKEAGIDLTAYQPKFLMGSTAGIVSAVEAKMGIGFVSSLAIKHSEALGLVKVVNVNNLILKTYHYFLHNKNMSSDGFMANFISFINQNTTIDSE